MRIFNRILLNIKCRSKDTLKSWSYQCESIIAQRSRRIQQLCTFYHRFYGTHGLKVILRSYHRQFEPPLRGIMITAVGAVGISLNTDNSNGDGNGNKKNRIDGEGVHGFDWNRERLSICNYEHCLKDLQFIETLEQNQLCPLCQEKRMKFCYCTIGNKQRTAAKLESRSSNGSYTRCRIGQQNDDCRTRFHLQSETPGSAMISMAEDRDWHPYFSKNEFLIWKREERPSMFSYKVYASFDDITAADLLHVQTDLEYRKHWDETATVLETIEEDPLPNTNSHLIYWEMRWPKLFANRDYVFSRRFITDDRRKVMMVWNRGTRHDKYPEFPNKVRVNDYWSFMVIKPFRSFYEPGVHYVLTYYDDPGLPIPQSIKSWVSQQQMPEFLKRMYDATKSYSCNRSLEMNKFMEFGHFRIVDNEYTANTARSGWIKRFLRQRGEPGK